MEEPKAAVPNGHSDSHTEDKPEQMEVDEVETKMKEDAKTDPKRTKSTDSDEATNSSPKAKTQESEKTMHQSFENALMQIEKSSIKKKLPQKIVKRSPRISRNKEPPEKDGETSKTEEKEDEKKTESPEKEATVEDEAKKENEVKKEVEGSKEVAATTNKEKKESVVTKEVEKKESKSTRKAVQFTGDPDADFLGFDDPKTSNYTSSRDKFQKMIDELVANSSPVVVASTSGISSRSRRSTTVKRDSAKEVESQQPKAGTSESVAEKHGTEPETEAGDDENKTRRSRPSQVAQSERKSSSPSVKRNFDVSLPQYLKPFEYGWKRELAYRNNTENFSKRMADVFYYTPLGKKIRSIGAVKDYLLGTDLTLDNFTFVTKAMNLNDPNKETIRDARKNIVNKPVTPTQPPLTTRKSAALSRTNSAESAGDNAEETPKASPLSTPKISLKSFRPPQKNKANKTPVPEKKSKKSSDDSDNDKDELEMGMLPPMWDESLRPDWSANGSTTMNKNSRSEAGGGDGEVEEGEDKVEVCSIRCVRMRGQIPTLACVVCLCLYHPECVSGARRNVLNYVCKNCQDAKNPSKKPCPPTLHSSPPPLVPISSSQSDASQSETSTPQLQRLLDKTQPNHKIVGGVTTWLPPSSMIHLTTRSTTTSKVSTTSHVTTVDSTSTGSTMPSQTLFQMNGKQFVYVPKHNVLSVSPATTTSSENNTTTNSGNLVSSGCVSMPSLIQNSVQSSFLSSIGKPNPKMSHALIVSDTANPSSNSGVLLVPCITTTTAAAGGLGSTGGDGGTPRILLVNGAGGLPTTNLLIGNMSAKTQQPQPSTVPPPSAANQSEKSGNKRPLETDKPEPEAVVSPPAKRSKKEPEATASDAPDAPKADSATSNAPVDSVATVADPVPEKVPAVPASSSVSVNKDYFMFNVGAIYHALLNSFQYLKVQELLRAARVCHMWRDVAMNRSLWHIVRMKNSRVRDWDGLANTLRQSGTRHLDLRKMLMPDKSEEVSEMWTRYAAAIDRVNSLWRVDLCRCPATAVESSARASPRLQYLAALAIKSNSLDASAFENCRNMIELRLKSSEKNGLDLENLSALKHLTKMKHLSLTTLKSFSADLAEVLENMKDLETLELGECSELSESVATKALPKLKRLQRLRLEKGQGDSCPTLAILNSVKDLKNLVQLELINFDIKSGFDTTIAKCAHLKTLLIIPTYVTQSATTNHLVMEGVGKLSKTLTLFVWGITLELLRVTDLFIDQWEGQKGAVKSTNAKKGSGDSIPILKPISETGNKEAGAPSQVDILQLPKLHKVLTTLLPSTKVKILKVPFSATWRQTVAGPAHIH